VGADGAAIDILLAAALAKPPEDTTTSPLSSVPLTLPPERTSSVPPLSTMMPALN
jgi:hypothetical protein